MDDRKPFERAGKLLAAASLSVLQAACGGGGGGGSDQPAAPAAPVPATPPAIQLVLFAGQSNAGQGGAGVTLEARALAPNVLQFTGAGKAGLGFEAQPASALTAMEPAQDTANGQYVATMTGFALGAGSSETYLLRTDWNPGQSLDAFGAGSINEANMVQALNAAKTLAGARGVQAKWLVWIQGESGPFNRQQYAGMLASQVSTMRADVASVLGQATTVLMVQTNTPDWTGWPSTATTGQDQVGLAQWDASTTPGAVMAGPMYQAPMIVDANDNIHSSSIGRMVLGDMLADVMKRANWKPLQPVSAVRSGRVVDVVFNVPAGPLAWDVEWVKPAPHYGFSFTDDSGSAVVESVQIVSANTVRVTLTAEPTGANPRIGYAQGEADGQLDGWAAGRGQLMSPTGRASFYRGLGYAVPATVNHYSVKFVLPV